MKVKRGLGRLPKNEQGFTLAEVLVTMVMMLTVMFALYSIFDMSLRVFSYGNNKIEAVENARLGLERMEREIRAAYPVDAANDDNHLFFTADGTSPPQQQEMPASGQITFGNDLNGNGTIECPDDGNCEYVTYRLDYEDSTLLQNNTANGSDTSVGGDPVVEFVNGEDGLEFEYLKSDGTEATTESEIQMVRITLEINTGESDDPITQTLTTDVTLRNRTGGDA